MASRLTEIQIDELQKQGHDLYRQKKYQAALQRFNAILQQDRKAPLITLDSRAATHTKLGDLPAALRDGRRMIQEYKASCSGYLRTGQILHKEDVASGIYKHGLRSVPASDPNRELIQGMYNKLIKHRSPSKTVDPLQVLPIEITEMILNYLNFKSMVICLRVSQSWRSLLCSMPNLWGYLDFSACTRNVPISTITSYIKRARGRVTRSSLRTMSAFPDIAMKCIAHRCKALTHLELLGGLAANSLVEAAPALENLKSVVVAAEISLDAISRILALCSSLTTAQFLSVTAKHSVKWEGDFSRLRSLSIDAKKNYPDRRSTLLNLHSLIPMISNIQTLSLRNWSGSNYSTAPPMDFSTLTQLERLDLAAFDTVNFPALPSSIQTLDVSTWHSCVFSSDLSQTHLEQGNLKALTSLFISSPSDLSLTELCRLLDPNKGSMTSMDISGCTDLTRSDISHIITLGYLASIVELKMIALPADDDIADLLAHQLPNLRFLDLGITKITGVGVKALTLKTGCKLERLSINHCRSVSIDAVEWARAQGINVSFTFSENGLKKSKRILV